MNVPIRLHAGLNQQRSKGGVPIKFTGLAFPMMRDDVSRLVRRHKWRRRQYATSRALVATSCRGLSRLDLRESWNHVVMPFLFGASMKFQKVEDHCGIPSAASPCMW